MSEGNSASSHGLCECVRQQSDQLEVMLAQNEVENCYPHVMHTISPQFSAVKIFACTSAGSKQVIIHLFSR